MRYRFESAKIRTMLQVLKICRVKIFKQFQSQEHIDSIYRALPPIKLLNLHSFPLGRLSGIPLLTENTSVLKLN